MKILGSDIRVGNIIEYKNDLWKCLKNQTSNRGNLRSHNQVELKSITKGTKLNERFRAVETVEKASLEEKKFQFLYSANDEFFFMDSENFEQISINKTLVEDCEKLLQEDIQVIATSSSIEKAIHKSWFNKVKYKEYKLGKNNITNLYDYFDRPDKMIHLAWQGLPNYTELFHFESNLLEQYFF